MKPSIVRNVMFGLLLVHCSVVSAQQNNSEILPLAELKSTDWHQRWAAYEKINAKKELLKRWDVKSALLDLFDRENQVIHMTFLTPNGRVGVTEKYGEGYTEYYYELEDTAAKIADWHDPRQVCILAEGSYNPDSPFAVRLAVEGGIAAVPCLLKLAQSNHGDAAVSVLIQLSAVTRDLTPAVRRQIRQATLEALQNPDERLLAVLAVGKFGTPDMIPILQDIARTDSFSRLLLDGTRRFDIRDAATKAIQSIQERASGERKYRQK